MGKTYSTKFGVKVSDVVLGVNSCLPKFPFTGQEELSANEIQFLPRRLKSYFCVQNLRNSPTEIQFIPLCSPTQPAATMASDGKDSLTFFLVQD